MCMSVKFVNVGSIRFRSAELVGPTADLLIPQLRKVSGLRKNQPSNSEKPFEETLHR